MGRRELNIPYLVLQMNLLSDQLLPFSQLCLYPLLHYASGS